MIVLGPIALLAAIVVDRLRELDDSASLVRRYAGTPEEQPVVRPSLRGVLLRWDGRRWRGDQSAWEEGRDEALALIPQGDIRDLLDSILAPGIGLCQGVEPGRVVDSEVFKLPGAAAVIPEEEEFKLPGVAAEDLRRIIRRLGVDLGAYEGGFWKLTEGDFTLKAEGWKDACLERGVGPWSWSQGIMEGTSDCEDPESAVVHPSPGPETLEAAIAEADLRASHLPIGIDPDARPADSQWVLDLWVPAPPLHEYSFVQISLWRKAASPQ